MIRQLIVKVEQSFNRPSQKPLLKPYKKAYLDIIKVTVQMADLQNALLAGGSPMTAIEMQKTVYALSQ